MQLKVLETKIIKQNRASHISCYRMQGVKVQVEPTRSAIATAVLNSKTTPQAARVCGIRH